MPDVVGAIAAALAGSGIEEIGSSSAEEYDARAPRELSSQALLPGARGVIVAASAGRQLWRAFREATVAEPTLWNAAHPLDHYVAHLFSCADAALDALGVSYRRFEPTLLARPALDFRALGEITGLGSMGPFGMLIHAAHGPWWALRGAYLVDVEVPPARSHVAPCVGCDAPCVGARGSRSGIELATPAVRTRCVVGRSSRYDDEQIAYHYDREATVAKLRS